MAGIIARGTGRKKGNFKSRCHISNVPEQQRDRGDFKSALLPEQTHDPEMAEALRGFKSMPEFTEAGDAIPVPIP